MYNNSVVCLSKTAAYGTSTDIIIIGPLVCNSSQKVTSAAQAAIL